MAAAKKKLSADSLTEALAYFQAGKSLRECEKLTGVNYKRIQREAAAKGIKQGSLSHLIEDMARVKRDFVTLPVTARQVVTDEANRIAAIDNYLTDAAVNSAKTVAHLSAAQFKKASMIDPEDVDMEIVRDVGTIAQAADIASKLPINIRDKSNANLKPVSGNVIPILDEKDAIEEAKRISARLLLPV